jgi:hypothetical protein
MSQHEAHVLRDVGERTGLESAGNDTVRRFGDVSDFGNSFHRGFFLPE